MGAPTHKLGCGRHAASEIRQRVEIALLVSIGSRDAATLRHPGKPHLFAMGLIVVAAAAAVLVSLDTKASVGG
jgi:hypothetical protein